MNVFLHSSFLSCIAQDPSTYSYTIRRVINKTTYSSYTGRIQGLFPCIVSRFRPKTNTAARHCAQARTPPPRGVARGQAARSRRRRRGGCGRAGAMSLRGAFLLSASGAGAGGAAGASPALLACESLAAGMLLVLRGKRWRNRADVKEACSRLQCQNQSCVAACVEHASCVCDL